MSLCPYKITALARIDAAGNTNIIENASVTVLDDTGNLATLWANSYMGSYVSNPFTCDTNGEKEFWVYAGIYSISVSGGQTWNVKLGENNVSNMDTGTLLDSLLPTSMAGKTITGLKLQNSSSSDPLVCDWYEEGTTIPTAYGLTSAGTGTYTRRTGKYTRIGNKVSFVIDLGWSAHTGTGTLEISGLPYTVGSATGYPGISSYGGLTVGANKELCISINSGATTLSLLAADPAGGASSNFAVDSVVSYFTISGFYFV